MTATLSTLPKLLLMVVLLVGGAAFSGCEPRSAEARSEKPVVTINQLELTAGELQREVQSQPSWFLHEEELSPEGEPGWLGRLIEKELLVQEAQRLGLDREASFMRTIERFWKEALIKHLLDRKSREISSQVQVYEPEIEARYQELLKDSNGNFPSYTDSREEMVRGLRQEKETEALDQWAGELRQKSRIVLDQEAMKGLGS